MLICQSNAYTGPPTQRHEELFISKDPFLKFLVSVIKIILMTHLKVVIFDNRLECCWMDFKT